MTRKEREQQEAKKRRAFAKALSESFIKPYADAVANISKECIEKIIKEKKMTEKKNVESKE